MVFICLYGNKNPLFRNKHFMHMNILYSFNKFKIFYLFLFQLNHAVVASIIIIVPLFFFISFSLFHNLSSHFVRIFKIPKIC